MGKDSTALMHHKFCLIDVASDLIEESDSNQSVHSDKVKNLQNLKKSQNVSVSKSEFQNKSAKKPNIVDLPKNGILMTGSMNWTNQGLTGNWENILIISQRCVLRAYQGEFNKLWNEQLKVVISILMSFVFIVIVLGICVNSWNQIVQFVYYPNFAK